MVHNLAIKMFLPSTRSSSTLGPLSSTMADMRESETIEEKKLAEILLNRELLWSDLPHTTRKGTMGFLELGRRRSWREP